MIKALHLLTTLRNPLSEETTLKEKETEYEEDILVSYEMGEWEPVPDLKDEIARYATCAAITLTKIKILP